MTTPSTSIQVWLTKSDRTGQTLMETLFDRLSGMYVGRWQAAFKSDTDVTNWANAWAIGFDSKRITPPMVKRGLDNCADMFAWPPSLPEFIKACQALGRDEQVTPPDLRALGHEAKFNPALAAKAVEAVKKNDDRTDHKVWIRRVWEKGERNVSPMAWRMANDAAKEFGITK